MSKYQILESKEEHDGVEYTVSIIPNLGDDSLDAQHTEIQKYKVLTGENSDEVLSRAAWHHEAEMKKTLEAQPAPKATENEVVEANPAFKPE